MQVQGDRNSQAAQQHRDGHVPDVLAVAVGVPRPQIHGHRRERVRDGGDQADLDDRQVHAEGLLEPADDRGQEEGQGVQTVGDAEVHQRQRPDPGTGQRAPQREVEGAGHRAFLGGQHVDQPLALLGLQPVRVGGAVGQVEPADDAEDDRRQSDGDHHELPAGQPELAVPHRDQPGRHGRPDGGGDRAGHHEDPDDAGPVGAGEPAGEVEDHAGEQSRLGDAEQEPQCEQGGGVGRETDCHHDDSPRHRDPGQPAPGAEPLQREVGRHLDQDVADEEDARSEAEHGRGELQVLADVGLGDAEVGAVEVVDEVQRHEQRQGAGGHAAQCARFQRLLIRGCDGHPASR